MADLELVKKILFEDGVGSVDVKHLKLALRVLTNANAENVDLMRKVFFCENLGLQVNKAMLVDFINYYGAENIYVGEKIDHYSKIISMDGRTLIPGPHFREKSSSLDTDLSGRKTLFKHDEHDYYYYDLLDQNRQCEHVNPDIFYTRNGCTNMVNIMSILEKQNQKVRRG